MQLAEVRSANGVAHGDQNVHASLDQHSFVDGDIDFGFGCELVGENPGRQRGNAVQAVRQESEGPLASLGDDARNAGLVGEDFER